MSGKPAARQGDMTRKGLDIVQGSAGDGAGQPGGAGRERSRNAAFLY